MSEKKLDKNRKIPEMSEKVNVKELSTLNMIWSNIEYGFSYLLNQSDYVLVIISIFILYVFLLTMRILFTKKNIGKEKEKSDSTKGGTKVKKIEKTDKKHN